MHVHASFSEGTGSMTSQLECARDAGVEVVWFTEHDWRMSTKSYRTLVHFDSLRNESQFGKPWRWDPRYFGSFAEHGGEIVSSPVSPNDPSPIAGALHVWARSKSSVQASHRMNANTVTSRQNHAGNITGTRYVVDVLVHQSSPTDYPELRIDLSNHPARGGLPAGGYVLSYRFGFDGAPSAQGLLGVVPVPVPPDTWTTVTLDLTADVARIWPAIIAEDNSTATIQFGAVSRGGLAEGWFDYLRIERSRSAGDDPLGLQASIIDRLQADYPDITMYCGQEVSFSPQHLNWFGGAQFLHQYTESGLHPGGLKSRLLSALVRQMQGSNGLVSLNHPFGTDGLPGDVEARRRTLATALLQNGAYGIDALEVAYQDRAGIPLSGYLEVWDALSRNCLFVSGTGVNDSHGGLENGGWGNTEHRFNTSAWSASVDPDSLIASLRSGRVFSTEVASGVTAIEVAADGVAMGQVSVRPDLLSRDLQITVAGLPPGGTAQVVQGTVDYAGASQPDPTSVVVATLSATDLTSGVAVQSVDTRTSSFLRAVIYRSDGRAVGVSNPIWLLHERPPGTVPATRRAADSTWT
jgi:hypothetical protein